MDAQSQENSHQFVVVQDFPCSQAVPSEHKRKSAHNSKVSMSFLQRSIQTDSIIQDAPEDLDHRIHRVHIEPERTGWARLYDLVRQLDKDRVADIKEDIDTLLVFVSPLPVCYHVATISNLLGIGRFILSCDHCVYYRIVQESPAAARGYDCPNSCSNLHPVGWSHSQR